MADRAEGFVEEVSAAKPIAFVRQFGELGCVTSTAQFKVDFDF